MTSILGIRHYKADITYQSSGYYSSPPPEDAEDAIIFGAAAFTFISASHFYQTK